MCCSIVSLACFLVILCSSFLCLEVKSSTINSFVFYRVNPLAREDVGPCLVFAEHGLSVSYTMVAVFQLLLFLMI
jgi:hypothetical protein